MISVIVLSRREAEKFELSNKQACISIYTPGDEPAKIQGGHVLPLCFHDLNDPNLKDKLMSSLHDPDRVFPVSMMEDEHAKAILDFVDTCISKGIITFVVHCDAGISRSPGVAVALNEIYNDEKHVPYRYAMYNTYVYSKIINYKHNEEQEKDNTDRPQQVGSTEGQF